MEDPFEKPLSTGDEHLRWPLADVAPEMLEVSVVAVRAQSRSPEPRVVPASPARTQPGFSDDSQTGNDSSRAPDRPSSPVPLTSLPPSHRRARMRRYARRARTSRSPSRASRSAPWRWTETSP